MINQDTFLFFEKDPEAFSVYRILEMKIFEKYPETKIKVSKTQISFSNRHLFACVSMMRVKMKSDLPAHYFVLTMGMPYSLSSERVAVSTEPYPGRWTTHFVISTSEQLDEELFAWLDEAYQFAMVK